MSDGPQPDDIVQQGSQWSREPRLPRLPGWPPSRAAAVLAAAALVVGAGAGYAAAERHGLTQPVKAAPSSVPVPAAPFAGSSAVDQDREACSTQTGHQLQLGVQLTNQSAAPVVLQTARFAVPVGGLKQVTWQWAACGALPGGPGQADEILPAGASIWLTATFTVQVRCPAASSVEFAVRFMTQGRSATASLTGFPDLSQVAYTGCPPVIPLGGTNRLSAWQPGAGGSAVQLSSR